MSKNINPADIAEDFLTGAIQQAVAASNAEGAPGLYRIAGEAAAVAVGNPDMTGYIVAQAITRLAYATIAASLVRTGAMKPKDMPTP